VTYVEDVLAPYIDLWSEAMLMATVHFIYKELGINTIYYHTYKSGEKLKQVLGGKPPRSLYADLPKKFCFQLTEEDPTFMTNDRIFQRKRRKINNVDWYKLTL